ncbi:uncharacterized protein LOC112183512 [Rosa chinensis]|uniref:uncharacterized protein LOC112183512 n=1 Tax=Rosa chinensis TaxID=74649 RepID=UPI000D08A23D|nr:uncharacterized protein LOC112183512 [Rosa chinensis]
MKAPVQVEKWSPPNRPFLKLNVDAATDGKCGVSGVCMALRDEVGQLKFAAHQVIPGNPPVLAIEALAVLHGLKLCLQEGCRNVELESDAANVLFALNKSGLDLSIEGAIFDEVRMLMPEFEHLKWRKINRSCNQVAHTLARQALRATGWSFWKEAGPPWLEEVIDNDRIF